MAQRESACSDAASYTAQDGNKMALIAKERGAPSSAKLTQLHVGEHGGDRGANAPRAKRDRGDDVRIRSETTSCASHTVRRARDEPSARE
jgi:hypothetical protein